MDFRYLKILTIGLALALVIQGCTIGVGGGGYHRHRGYRHHSSLPQSAPFAAQATAQNSGDPAGHEQMVR